MSAVLPTIKVQINEKLFVKDPETSELGKKIISQSISLIDELGFEHFTFKKLGVAIDSNESSVYRYFESKHKLLLYLSSWYWSWIEYKLIFSTANIADPMDQLKAGIIVVTEKITDDISTSHIDEEILNRIIIAEFTKTFLTKDVDEENKEGFFLIYKRVIGRLVTFVEQCDPNYIYAKSLVSTIVQGALHQHYLRDHLKTLTSISGNQSVSEFYIELAKKALNHK